MIQYLHYGMSGIAALMLALGIMQLVSHQDDKIPTALSAEPINQTSELLRYNAAMLRSVGDQIVGAVLISGGFIGGCLLWF